MDNLLTELKKLKLRESPAISKKCIDDILEMITAEDCDKASAGKTLVTEGILPELQHHVNLSDENVMKAAKLVAELAKTSSVREECVKQKFVDLFTKHLSSSDVETCTQVCRALGNICYDNDVGREAMSNCEGLEKLYNHLKRLHCDKKDDTHKASRMMGCGCLLNLTNTNELLQEKAIKLGALDLMNGYMQDYIDDEDLMSMVLMTVSSLVDSESAKEQIIDSKLPTTVVKLYESPEVAEIEDAILELLATLAEDDSVKNDLCKTALTQHLLATIRTHQDSDEDDSQTLVKLAADLIILLLTGDDSMQLLYNDGSGPVFLVSKKWLQCSHPHLRVCGALAIGNFARGDANCINLVKDGTTNVLIESLQITADDDISSKANMTMLHAVLSALRNIAIPASNKSAMINAGVLEKVLQFMSSDAAPVQFKLLGLLRMAVDGQEEAAKTLGTNEEFLKRLVAWCSVEEHAGVKGEANRLMASLIKNSRSSIVMNTILQIGGLKHLVSMATSEHTVMQNEALVALNLMIASIIGTNAASIKDSDLIPTIMTLLNDEKLLPELMCNTLSLVNGLHSADVTREAIQTAEILPMVQKHKGHSDSIVQERVLQVLATYGTS
ncbi:rap1 GTPase-GDP dissociation stimulator 1-like [Lineus longissimus]|uniref:rap1 GTPase-GDP dissociation stimulator 1-like n=1 Tax=Lineus longissimus TaxID=88925 RepID=UPI002B4ED920